jgi:vitamin B12 transporter
VHIVRYPAKKALIMSSVAVIVLSALPAAAETVDGDTIVVTAGRMQQNIDEVANSTTVITHQDIETRQSIAVADLLRTTPGVTVTSNGGLGAFTAVNIRGANSEQTVMLIDGVKLDDPSSPGGGYNFGDLTTGNIDRIEVVRGSQSVLWGSQAIGGVINVITRAPTDQPSLDASGEYGWRSTAHLTADASGKFGPVSVSAGGEYLRTDGYSAFDVVYGGKEQDSFEHYGAHAKVNVAVTDAISVDLRGWYADGTAGIDGFPPPDYSFGDTPEYAKTKQFVGYAGLNVAPFDDRWHNRVAYTLADTKRHNIDLTGGFDTETFYADGRNERFEYQGILDLNAMLAATFGAETEKASYKTSSYGGPFEHASATTDSFYAQLTFKPLTGLAVTGGLRHDDHDTFGGKTTFAANAVYTPNEGHTILRASFGEGFKTPTLYQLYGDYGNTLLNPESSKSWDAGITQRLLDGRLEAGVTWFQRNTQNQIIFISCTTPLVGICTDRPYGTYDNVAVSEAKGLELTLALRPVDPLRIQAAYTYTHADDELTGNDLPRRPRHSVNASVDYDWGFGLKTGFTVTHVSPSFDDAGNTRKLDGYALVDLRASYPLTRNLELFARIENLFDEQYETAYQYGTARRAGYAGVRFAI